MSETYPRRFVIWDRDHLDRILVEGCQWTNGGISTLLHGAPWAKATNGMNRALVGIVTGFEYPGNVEEVETLAATCWGEVHWLDKTDAEIEAATAKAAEDTKAAWQEVQAAMTDINFGARRPWGPEDLITEIAGLYPPEEDSENKPAGRRFAPGPFPAREWTRDVFGDDA